MNSKKIASNFNVYTPIKSEILSAQEFKELVKSSKSSLVKRSRFLPPSPDRAGFGSFVVEYRIPLLKNTKTDLSAA